MSKQNTQQQNPPQQNSKEGSKKSIDVDKSQGKSANDKKESLQGSKHTI